MTLLADRSLAFSTLGCPAAPLDEVVALAELGDVRGIELRCTAGELLEPTSSPQHAARLGDGLKDAGLLPVCVASYVRVGSPDNSVEAQLEKHIELAHAVGAPYVRVFAGDPEHPDSAVADRAAERLHEVPRLTRGTGVQVLLETHDVLLTGAEVADVLQTADANSVGALWDVVNPWRAGEPVETTAAHLDPWLRHMQFKDVRSPHDLRPILPGQGAVPLTEVRLALERLNYRGWASLEWEAAWYPDADPLADALLAYRSLMRRPLP